MDHDLGTHTNPNVYSMRLVMQHDRARSLLYPTHSPVFLHPICRIQARYSIGLTWRTVDVELAAVVRARFWPRLALSRRSIKLQMLHTASRVRHVSGESDQTLSVKRPHLIASRDLIGYAPT